MTRPTPEQKAWYAEHHLEFDAGQMTLRDEIFRHLSEAFDAMSELEDLINTGMSEAGYDTYALSRNRLHKWREEILSMAKRYGKARMSYPLMLPGGEYRD